MTSRNAAVEMLLAELRAELSTPPRESIAADHIRMMSFEQRVFVPAPFVVRERLIVRARRAASARPRRAAALVAAVCVLSGSIGLNAAGALPGALSHVTDHITKAIVHTFGVPQAPHSGAAGDPRRGETPAADSSLPARAPSVHGSVAGTTGSAAAGSVDGQLAVPQLPTLGGPDPTGPPTGSHPPIKRPFHKPMQKDPGLPPGFPADWRTRAIDAARSQLVTCTQAETLAPAGCPQVATSAGTPTTVHWTLLGQPLAAATAVAKTVAPADVVAPAPGTVAPDAQRTVVSVYGRFQMGAAYTEGTETVPAHNAYSGGIALATMMWNGSSFQSVRFASGSVAGSLPTGVYVPAFDRPAQILDSTALAAVQTGFAACATAASLPDTSIANCPQTATAAAGATTAQWALDSDPSQGAVVSFDTQHGNFTVTGTYSMTLSFDNGAPPVTVTGQYTATLAFDGLTLHLIAISGSG